jgi:hypothetical protein
LTPPELVTDPTTPPLGCAASAVANSSNERSHADHSVEIYTPAAFRQTLQLRKSGSDKAS